MRCCTLCILVGEIILFFTSAEASHYVIISILLFISVVPLSTMLLSNDRCEERPTRHEIICQVHVTSALLYEIAIDVSE
jgi:hypothetical protein